MKNLITFFLIVLSHVLVSQIPPFIWARAVGGSGTDLGRSICNDGQGNVYVTGSYTGTVDFDPGPSVYTLSSSPYYASCYVLKLNSLGHLLWAKTIGGTSTSFGNAEGYCIKTDPAGNVYLTGIFRDNVDFDPGPGTYTLTSTLFATFTCKLNAAGLFVWVVQQPLSSSSVRASLDLDNAGNIYVCSTFSNVFDFDPGPVTYTLASAGNTDIFLQALTTNGSLIWAKSFGGTDVDGTTQIVCSKNSGNIFITGYFRSTADFDPAASTYPLTSFGMYDGFISCLSNSGNFLWAGQFGGLNYESGESICLDGSDNVYVTGGFVGTADFDPGPAQVLLSTSGALEAFVAKLSATGNLIYAKQFSVTGASASSAGTSVRTDASGNLYVAGQFNSPTDFDPGTAVYTLTPLGTRDAFLVNFNAAGNFIDVKQFNTTNVNGITIWDFFIDASKSIYGTGNFAGTGDFDPDIVNTYTLTALGFSDFHVFKLAMCNDVPVLANNYYACPGNLTLTATSSSTISWYANQIGGTALATGSVFVTPSLAPGSYTYYAGASSCTTAGTRAPVIFSVAALPSVQINASPPMLCEGSNVTLLASGADTYTWQSSVQGMSITITPTISTTYSVSGTNTLTGCANSSSLLVNYFSLPVIQITPAFQGTVCAGSNVVLSVSGANTYTWSNALSASTIAVTPSLSTTYSVIGTSSISGCSNNASIALSVVPCVSLKEEKGSEQISLFPNPVRDRLFIKTPNDLKVIVINSLGAKILEYFVLAGEPTVDLSQVSGGIYFVFVKSKNQVQTFKIVKVE